MEVNYGELLYGIYIQGVSGKYYNRANWNNQETVNCIAVHTENCSFGISLNFLDDSAFADSDDINFNLTEHYTESGALEDFNDNTYYIANRCGFSYAAGKCVYHNFPNGKYGHLPSMGETTIINDNKNEIENCLYAVGGDDLSYLGRWWTCTYYGVGSDETTRYFWRYAPYGNYNIASLTSIYKVRPLCKLF